MKRFPSASVNKIFSRVEIDKYITIVWSQFQHALSLPSVTLEELGLDYGAKAQP